MDKENFGVCEASSVPGAWLVQSAHFLPDGDQINQEALDLSGTRTTNPQRHASLSSRMIHFQKVYKTRKTLDKLI